MEDTVDLERLKGFSLFADLAEQPERLAVVSQYLAPRRFLAGEYIFHEGDMGDELFLLVQGAVRVLKLTKQKEEYTIVDLQASYQVFFGEIALMDSDKRSASIQVLEDCLTYVINRDAFVELGNKHPEIALPITRVIAGILCGRLRNVNNDVIMLFDALVNEIETTQL
ncbi:MAG: cyclic nucleotide-binding domain-containing protein [bacterium]|nr:cyclic nucleotide-binding domain-containing protein [bacterium]